MKNGKPLILLVEDSKTASIMAISLLEELGCSIDLAETGEQALEMVARETYDLVFMDLGLPEAGGIATTAGIKKMQGIKNVPVIALTAHNTEELKDECFRVGMDGYITKPLEKEKVDYFLKKYMLIRG
ncbi:MAG: hypothetical protein K0Q74_1187 [Gammaproteobacteria bacterium]|jgi:CheY-like chemotaxis protein|nr:hypothetical protein [Gammaproteobacteria bacterium]